MQHGIVTIVIPVYNVEKYLDRCVESVINQSYENLEIILVDDESPDNCPAICDEWAQKDNRIKVIHKKNAGLGMARNSGIEAATGDYITFLDSDDYLHRDTCKTAVQAILDNDAGICCYGYTDVYGGKEFPIDITKSCGVYKKEKIVDPFLVESIAADEYSKEISGIGISACMVMYKADIFKDSGLRFLSEREYMNEDLAFRIELCKHIKCAVIIPQPFYYYYHNTGTLTTSYRADRLQASVTMYEKVNELVQFYNSPELYKRNMRYFMVNLIVCLKHEILFASQHGYSKAFKNLRSICKNETVINIMKSYPIDRLPLQQRLLFQAVKHKSTAMIWALCSIKKVKDSKNKNIN